MNSDDVDLVVGGLLFAKTVMLQRFDREDSLEQCFECFRRVRRPRARLREVFDDRGRDGNQEVKTAASITRKQRNLQCFQRKRGSLKHCCRVCRSMPAAFFANRPRRGYASLEFPKADPRGDWAEKVASEKLENTFRSRGGAGRFFFFFLDLFLPRRI